MADFDNITYSSWMDYKSYLTPQLFGDGCFERGRFLFRGHASDQWQLSSKFDREFDQLKSSERLQIADLLLDSFKNECISAGVMESTVASRDRVLALGQHYGLPTRLLDWTESPYVAAFFAFADVVSSDDWNVRSGRVAVWALHCSHGAWSVEQGVEIIDPPVQGNERIRNQSGKFTYARTPFMTLEEYVGHCPDSGVALTKFILPATEARFALSDLEAMGITHARLYPDLVGMAARARMSVFLRRAFG